MKEPIKVFIGYDHSEAVAYHTLCHSIMTKSSVPVSITPICLDNLKDIFSKYNVNVDFIQSKLK